MGGNAFDGAESLTAEEYRDVCAHLVTSLDEIMVHGCHFAIPQSVREKETHGDIDVLVYSRGVEDAFRHLNTFFDVRQYIKNPSGYNVLLFIRDKYVQVDLNKVSMEDFNFAYDYFSWNDLGNLIGRIAHRQGLKFGHDGLWYIYRDGDQLLGEVLITGSYLDALEYLGFDSQQYEDGFDTFEDMFRWVETSQYFEPCAFPLEHRNHQARMRDSKRKTYQAFLRRINFDGEYVESDKAAWLKEHIKRWPHLGDAIEKMDAENALNKLAKEKLNGLIVSQLTGLQGKELGALMQVVKRVLPRELVIKHDAATIEQGIMFAFAIYKEETNDKRK